MHISVVTIVVLVAVLIFIGNHRLSVTTQTIVMKNLTESFEGFTIVHLSDLHDKKFGKGQKRLLSKINAVNADICIITGDIVERKKRFARNSLQLISQLSKRQPVFLVTGNHEGHHGDWENIQNLVEETGAKILRGKTNLSRDGAYLFLMGIDDPAFYDSCANPYVGAFRDALEKVAASRENSTPSILLSHRPEIISLYSELGFDLVFAGHAHGGLWRIPWIGGIAAPDQGLFPKYTAGIYKDKNTTMIVSRGLGSTKLPIRIFNPPEIVVVRLCRANA